MKTGNDRMENNKKKILNEVIWALFFIIYILLTNFLLIKLQHSSNIKTIFFYIALVLISILFGLLIGLPLSEDYKNGIYFDWTKFIIQGLPSFILATIFIIPAKIFTWFVNIYPYPSQYLLIVASIWFGKIISNCIKEKPTEGS